MPIRPYPETMEELEKEAWIDQLYHWGFDGEDPEAEYAEHCDKENAGLLPKQFTKPTELPPSKLAETIKELAALFAVILTLFFILESL
mgnify:CR=1 FL=1